MREVDRGLHNQREVQPAPASIDDVYLLVAEQITTAAYQVVGKPGLVDQVIGRVRGQTPADTALMVQGRRLDHLSQEVQRTRQTKEKRVAAIENRVEASEIDQRIATQSARRDIHKARQQETDEKTQAAIQAYDSLPPSTPLIQNPVKWVAEMPDRFDKKRRLDKILGGIDTSRQEQRQLYAIEQKMQPMREGREWAELAIKTEKELAQKAGAVLESIVQSRLPDPAQYVREISAMLTTPAIRAAVIADPAFQSLLDRLLTGKATVGDLRGCARRIARSLEQSQLVTVADLTQPHLQQEQHLRGAVNTIRSEDDYVYAKAKQDPELRSRGANLARNALLYPLAAVGAVIYVVAQTLKDPNKPKK